tara:strand:+ start:28 stop:1350 length:1323 start_codon:yes stop_codon:yes gene_type:complete
MLKCHQIAEINIQMMKGVKKCSALCIASVALLSTFLMSPPLQAKDELRVIALVNSEPITNLELTDRVSYLRRITQLKVSEEILRRDALQGLIADRLKQQFGRSIAPGTIPRLESAAQKILDNNFGHNGKTGSLVLKELNIPQRTVLNKIKADILWSNALRLKFKRQFENIKKTAQQELNRLIQLKSEPQVRFSEIILLPNPNRSPEATLSLGEKIVAAIDDGADFASIAQQYSDAATASRGGLVDWVFAARLPSEIRTPLMSTKIGEIVGPLSLGGQIFVLRKSAMRENGLLDPLETEISLARAVAQIPLTSSIEKRRMASDLLHQQTKSINSCTDMAEFASTLAPDISPMLENLTIGSLTPQLQKVILELNVGDKTTPIAFSEGMVVFMLCEKKSPDLDLPDLKEIEQAELEKLVSTLSGRFLLRLQRQASIIYKDNTT